MRSRWSSVLSAALATAAILAITSGLLIAYWQNARYEDPIRMLNPQAHFATMMDHDTLVVGRQFEILRDVEFQATRELTRRDAESLVRVELPSLSVFYRPGKYSTERVLQIPTLKPGVYQLHQRVCWQVNVLRKGCMDLAALDVEIFPAEYTNELRR